MLRYCLWVICRSSNPGTVTAISSLRTLFQCGPPRHGARTWHHLVSRPDCWVESSTSSDACCCCYSARDLLCLDQNSQVQMRARNDIRDGTWCNVKMVPMKPSAGGGSGEAAAPARCVPRSDLPVSELQLRNLRRGWHSRQHVPSCCLAHLASRSVIIILVPLCVLTHAIISNITGNDTISIPALEFCPV
jgi:hypothetical protein